ncbi:MAG: Fe-S cluster assembly ATPase SufC [Lachnospiraceae bacterium]|nr:Fe-S cluster assembly ATPase SufC [Lachnospiraceae bacterium]MBQ7261909.1 Fe-S cluster assembly ATPase SufC [Lachnospiraceae bacterium]HAV01182.1 Fe-S cluster assembly ATPase SufC [Lachnospiraceae bacterium]
MALLEVKGLCVSVEDNEILSDINLSIGKGETHVLMGPNGAGKSTLGNALMGNPSYRITAGRIYFNGLDIKDDTPDKRAKAGMFMSFQNPLEVPGISLSSFIRNAIIQQSGQKIKLTEFRKSLASNMELLNFDSSYKDRDLNVGFSGGEKKKAEILQLLMLKPGFAILDETDSGLDVDAVRTVSEGIREYQKKKDGALLIITHSTRILDSLKVDHTHILVKGRIVESGDSSLVEEINKNGFEKYLGAQE